MEIYNITQDEWMIYQCPTDFGHTHFPALWTDPNYGIDILYIAGDYLGGTYNTKNHIGCIECIDFRSSNPSWKSIWELQTMQNIFFDYDGTRKTTGIFSICC